VRTSFATSTVPKTMATYLVCALDDSPMAVPGATFNRTCVCCRRRVMVSPEGERALADRKDLEVMCLPCGEDRPNADWRLLRPLEEMLRAVETSVPNPRRVHHCER